MIRITAACRLATPAACWEPNSLWGLRSVTHAPPHTRLPSPTCISHHCSIGGTLGSNDRCLAPPSFSFSSVILLFRSWTPSSFRYFFKQHTAHTLKHTSIPPPPPPLRHLKTKERGDVSFTTKVETHPHRHLLLLFRHGVNTNEEEMSPLLCPHLSQRPRDIHTHPCLSLLLCFYLSHSPVSHPSAVSVSSNVMQFFNGNMVKNFISWYGDNFLEKSFEFWARFIACSAASLNRLLAWNDLVLRNPVTSHLQSDILINYIYIFSISFFPTTENTV